MEIPFEAVKNCFQEVNEAVKLRDVVDRLMLGLKFEEVISGMITALNIINNGSKRDEF